MVRNRYGSIAAGSESCCGSGRGTGDYVASATIVGRHKTATKTS
jgi:hypothetical protein